MAMFYRLAGIDDNFYMRCEKVQIEQSYRFYRVQLSLWKNILIWYKFFVPGTNNITKWEALTHHYGYAIHCNRSLSVNQKEIIVYVISNYSYSTSKKELYESCCAILRFIRYQSSSPDELLHCLKYFEQCTLRDKRTECVQALELVCYMLYVCSLLKLYSLFSQVFKFCHILIVYSLCECSIRMETREVQKTFFCVIITSMCLKVDPGAQ